MPGQIENLGALAALFLLTSAIAAPAQTPEAPPAARGCITDTSAGDHVFTCGGLRVDVRVPAVCTRPGCGLILEIHGDTGTGLLEDAHTKLRDLGARAGYIVLAPTGPAIGKSTEGSTWSPANDATLVDIVRQFADVFRVDQTKVHVTGFSRGGYTTWRLLCDHADLFASAAPAAAGATAAGPCFAPGRVPSRKVPILFMLGRTDAAVTYPSATKIRDAAIAYYGATGPRVLASDATYSLSRWTSPDGVVIDVLEHGYENAADGSWAGAKGHCIPGSTVDPAAPRYRAAVQRPDIVQLG